MRQIEIEEGLRLRFKDGSAEFDRGIEIGILAALMAQGIVRFSRLVSSETVPQAEALARALGYRLVAENVDDRSYVTLCSSAVRPKLRLLKSVG